MLSDLTARGVTVVMATPRSFVATALLRLQAFNLAVSMTASLVISVATALSLLMGNRSVELDPPYGLINGYLVAAVVAVVISVSISLRHVRAEPSRFA